MSIYASTLAFDDDHAPILYRGSHLYPDPTLRGGQLDLAVIPGHIAPDGGYDGTHEHYSVACHRPFLRIDMHDPYGGEHHAAPSYGTLLLDAKQVEELRDNLSDFLVRITGAWCSDEAVVAKDRQQYEEFLSKLKVRAHVRPPEPELPEMGHPEFRARKPHRHHFLRSLWRGLRP